MVKAVIILLRCLQRDLTLLLEDQAMPISAPVSPQTEKHKISTKRYSAPTTPPNFSLTFAPTVTHTIFRGLPHAIVPHMRC
jgi:hypothetical protein